MAPGVSQHFVFQCSSSARDFLLEEGTDAKFGARHLKRSIERHLVSPLSCLLATNQIEFGDVVTIEIDRVTSKLKFRKEIHGALVRPESFLAPEPGWLPETGEQQWVESRVQ